MHYTLYCVLLSRSERWAVKRALHTKIEETQKILMRNRSKTNYLNHRKHPLYKRFMIKWNSLRWWSIKIYDLFFLSFFLLHSLVWCMLFCIRFHGDWISLKMLSKGRERTTTMTTINRMVVHWYMVHMHNGHIVLHEMNYEDILN